ncbi:MAG: M14 family metallopeptidase, partial [Pyrinomonadaceae bacterium]
LALILILAFALPFASPVHPTQAQTNTLYNAGSAVIPAPHEVLGFTPGDDRKLASWNQILTYFDKLDRSSNRVMFQTLGKTTMDKPFVMAVISAPENLAKLEDYQAVQEALADPRKIDGIVKGARSLSTQPGFAGVERGMSSSRIANQLIKKGKTFVLITCGVHSTEVGSTLSSMLIAHRLASSDEPEIQEILRNTILLLVPSLNPDGVDIVKNWYDKTLGTPYEGTDPPELYHKYVGHDNNRDWYAFTQVETQLTVDKIHNVWHPQIVHDIHQQGQFASRLFLPPYMPPVEPNVPKQIVEGYTELGSWIAGEMRKAGFQGITTGTTYDAWTPARAYSHYHGGVRILSETASARIATPVTLKFEQLRSREGYDPQKESDKFGPVWRGGEWHLRDITNYMTTAAFKLLQHAAQNRERWLSRFYEVGKEAVRPRKKGELFAFIVPAVKGDDWRRTANRDALLGILDQGGVVVEDTQPFSFEGSKFPNRTAIVRMDQPYASFAKTLLERQTYPDLRDNAGHPVAPYDVTAHTLPLLMDVTVIAATSPIRYKIFSEASGWNGVGGCGDKPSYGLYRSYVPSMDEGWTRWILEKEMRRLDCFTYRQITNEDLRAETIGKLDSIIIPDQAPRTILNGHRAGVMPPEYTGGLDPERVKALREFVEQGGTLVFLNRASDFAIEHFKLPVRNVVAGLPRRDFYAPGSILRIELDTSHPIAGQMPKESIAWFEDSPVFDVPSSNGVSSNVRVVAWYPRDKDPLLSGWLLGGDRIKGKAALVEVTLGKGRMILFGFRPQYRAQSFATFPLFFNSISMK